MGPRLGWRERGRENSHSNGVTATALGRKIGEERGKRSSGVEAEALGKEREGGEGGKEGGKATAMLVL